MESENTKTCNQCEIAKPFTEYYLRKENNTLHKTCRGCQTAKNKQKRLNSMSPERLERFQSKLEQNSYAKLGQRKCQTCSEVKLLEEYKSRSGKKKYSNCISCRPKVRKEYYARNPHQQVKRHQGVLANKQWVNDYTLPLKEAGCADCKKYLPDAMEFDHTCHPSEKLYNINSIHSVSGSNSNLLEILKSELSKGEYVCVNCHKLRTYSRQSNNFRIAYLRDKDTISIPPYVKHVYKVLEDSNCFDCGEKDFRLLEFDHVRGKKHSNISWMMKQARPFHNRGY